MYSDSSETDTKSCKDLSRDMYWRRVHNERDAKARHFKRATRSKPTKQWQQSYKFVVDSKMDTIFEQSFEPHFGLLWSREDHESMFKNMQRRMFDTIWDLCDEDVPDLERRSPELDPHFGLETIGATSFAIETLARFANIQLPEKILREVEGLILLLINLSQQTTSIGVMSSVLSWVQGRTSKALFTHVKDFIELTLLSPQSDGTPDWLSCLRDMKDNWNVCRNNKAFKQISKLLGCLVTLGLCDAANVTFNIGQFALMTPDLKTKHSTAFDIADAIFQTVIYFTEGAYRCFETGSLKPFLVDDHSAMSLDTEYAQVTAWFDLVRNGNLKKFADMSDQEFEVRMNDLGTNLKNLAETLDKLDRKLVMDKFAKIVVMQNDFISIKLASGTRHAPFALELFGESSQGKTTFADQLLDALMISQNMAGGKRTRCVYNPSDKYMSNWTTDKLVMIFDDVANDKSSFVERPPTRALLDVINNQMFYAPKAELQSKGKCFVEPWIAIATTNKKDLDAGLYSNCPYSIQRRFICITVKAKPEFQRIEGSIQCGVDSAKVRRFYTNDDGVFEPPVFDDIWTVTVEQAVKPGKLTTVAGYAPLVYKGKELKDISMAECIQWAIEEFDEHRKNQEALLEGMRQRANLMKRCHVEGCIHLEGNCPYHTIASEDCDEDSIPDLDVRDSDDESDYEDSLEEHFGRETIGACSRLWHGSKPNRSLIDRLYDRADTEAAEFIYKNGVDFLDRWNWIKLVPEEFFDHEYAIPAFQWLYKDQLTKNYDWECRRLLGTAALTSLSCMFLMPNKYGMVAAIACCCQYLSSQKDLYERIEEDLFQELRETNLQIAPRVKEYRDKYAKRICQASLGIAALYGLARAYRAYINYEVPAQGSLKPKTRADVEQRDAETNVWTSIVKRDLPITDYSKRMSAEHLSEVVTKGLVYGTVHAADGNYMVNGLMLSSNVVLIPDHYFENFGDRLECTFRKRNPDASGGKFTSQICKKFTHLIPNSDLRVCYVPNGGSYKNLVNFFPVQEMPSVPFKMHYRDYGGEMIIAKGMTAPGIVSTGKSFVGGSYRNFTMNTFEGLCGATLVSETNGSVILGVHLGGTAGTPIGVYGSVTQQQLFTAFAELRKMEGVILSGEAGKFETTVLGVQVLKDTPLHAKSPLNYMPENSQVEYLGSCIGRSVTTSEVQVMPISEHVLDVCNVPNIYVAPKFKPDWFGWQTCLANLANPARSFPQDLLEIAIRDYKEILYPIFKSNLWNDISPLSDVVNLCGMPGKKYLDAINLNTSVGFPLTGPKRDYITELEPTKDRPNNRVLDQVLVDEINRIEDCYRRGERGYPIAKACKKDEILTKEKCRIFYGNALSLTYLIRKYYLPILRVLQMNPLDSECAVGINSHGPEWQKFHEHATKFGMDRLFGGDYGKYDQKLPSQLIFASLRILIDFARICEYTEEDLRIMEAMTGDIVFAYISFNGDLIGLTEGTHISGNSLTVILNGICGSLNLRCFFYTQYPVEDFEQRLKFRENVAIMTYGDDNIGSVRPGIDKFTIKGCSAFLAEYGQVYTMPDKESELLDFLPAEEFEFLKRDSVWHPKLNHHVGALLDKSIYKSLHCFMRGKHCPLTKEHACAQNIDGALREWFNHGEDKYEKQRVLMKEVANRAGISHMCTGLDRSYDERVEEWFSCYKC